MKIFIRQVQTHMGPIAESIQSKIRAALEPTLLDIIDESHMHAGHAAMKGLACKETHFKVEIVSDKFKGQSLIQRHKLVYSLLDQEMKNGIHALRLSTKTKEESV